MFIFCPFLNCSLSRCSKLFLHRKCIIGAQMFPSGEGFCPPITGEPKGVIAGYVTEAEGDRCVSRMCFQCENGTY